VLDPGGGALGLLRQCGASIEARCAACDATNPPNARFSLMLQPAPFSPGDVELGYHFARRGQHRGFATEATRALVEHAFAVSSLGRVVAAIALGNVSSLKLAARHAEGRRGDARRPPARPVVGR
jgi:RimJ/RimL family protein N-acetyltransferase